MSIIHDPSTGVARADELAQLGERMLGFLTASKAPATLWAYRTDLAAFAADIAGALAVGTIGGRLSSLSVAHTQAGYDNPTQDPMD